MGPLPFLPAHTAWENAVITFPKTNRLPLKNRGWETRFLFGDNGLLGVLIQEGSESALVLLRSAMTCLRRLLLGRIKMT